MAYTYDYPHPAVTVDVMVFTFQADELKVLLIQRGRPPAEGAWAIPGGFVNIDESLRRAAWRELREETGVHAAYLRQLGAFGHPDRDPRERIITVVYLALLPVDRIHVEAGSDAMDARLFGLQELPELAFDHAKILRRCHERLQQYFTDPSTALHLLPQTFTMSQLRRVHEQVLGETLDKRNFSKKMQASGLVAPTGAKHKVGAHRPAALYRAA